MSRRSGSLEFGTATSYEAGPELPSPDPSPPHAFTKNESPQYRHADDCGDSSAGRIRSVVSAPRRAWPDRLPFPLSYGLDSGAPVRRALVVSSDLTTISAGAELPPSCLRMASHRRPSRSSKDRCSRTRRQDALMDSFRQSGTFPEGIINEITYQLAINP